VTCYTCHRGNPVPANIWFDVPEDPTTARFMGNRAAQNAPGAGVGLTALPGAPLRPFLAGDENIRIISTQPVDSDNRASIKQAEWTYGLMMHFSSALGVNCTHCHNTRSMGEWSVSPPTRAQAWFGIRLVRELNKDFLEPLVSALPKTRLGALGDSPKANCATCHAGAYRPLLGVSMLTDYQVLAEAKPQPAKTPEPVAVAPADAADGGAVATAALGDGGAASAEAGAAAGDAGAAAPAGAKGPAGAKKPAVRPAAHP
jgi:photosynthetic reaction center cytochrome c subunit